MIYNDHIETEQQNVLNTKEELLEGQYPQKTKQKGLFSYKNKFTQNQSQMIKGKQNNKNKQNRVQNLGTNHSFNGFFNENNNKFKNKQPANQNFNSKQEFSNSGNFSDFKFVSQSTKNFDNFNNSVHNETRKFVMKYFPENFNSPQFFQQYLILNDFVQLVFEQYENVIGKQTNINLFQQFTNKIYSIFGKKVYFQDLFNKTTQNGMIGLILQVFKTIQQDEIHKRNLINSNQIKSNPLINDSKFKNLGSSHVNRNIPILPLKSQSQQRMLVMDSYMPIQNPLNKISLDSFFNSNQNSKINISHSTNYSNRQDLDEIKNVLSDYIEQMYEEADKKLNKKYSQELKKVNLKYKQTEKLLEKINEKVSNHYDSLLISKEYEKKIKLLKEKQIELQSKIKILQQQKKLLKDEFEKQKINSDKQQQEVQKLAKKMQKYQNAIFQKAMEKNSNTSLANSQIISNIPPEKNQSVYGQNLMEKPRFQFKIDTFTQHRPVTTTFSPININPTTVRSYSPYLSRQIVHPTTPKQGKENQRASISPIAKRISFNRPINQPVMNPNLQISTVNRVQIGDPIVLKPISPLNKLQSNAMTKVSQNLSLANPKGQFIESRIVNVSPLRK